MQHGGSFDALPSMHILVSPANDKQQVRLADPNPPSVVVDPRSQGATGLESRTRVQQVGL